MTLRAKTAAGKKGPWERRVQLRLLSDCCSNLFAEAGLYRWSGRGEVSDNAEAPLNEHNHALSALRYLISRLDARKMARVA